MNVIIGENEIFKRLRTDVTEAETVRTNAVLTFIVVVLYNLTLTFSFSFHIPSTTGGARSFEGVRTGAV